jgi:ABC-type multidrug transport system fused ATPase/permease subunit
MLVGMMLETLGIGLIIPALALMTQSNLVSKYPALAPWMTKLGNPSQEQLVVAGMLVLVSVAVVKSLFLAFLASRQMRFWCELEADISQRLFAGYLRQPYTFHLQRNSAHLIHNATTQTSSFAAVVQQGLVLTTESLVLLGISALLFAVEPIGALVVICIFGLPGWCFHRFTRGHILRWGAAAQHHLGMRIQHLQQGLGGAKDIKLLGREVEFLDQYWIHNAGVARVGRRSHTLQALPRLWLELFAAVGLAALVLVMIWQGKPLAAVIPTLGMFAAAAFRVMPSVNRILGGVQTARYALPAVDNLYNEFCLLRSTEVPRRGQPLPFKGALTLEAVSFRYPSAESVALREVSLSIPRGASVGIIGGSGAGKSTLVDVILGLLTPDAGAVKIDGVDVQPNLRAWQDQLGYVPQSIYLSDDTLRRNVAFGLSADVIDEAAVVRAIHAAQLEKFVDDLPQGLETVVGERGVRLSGGQRQRIGIARALYHNPPVLVLDEATSSLDVDTERGIMDAVRAMRGDKTLLIVAHRLSTVEHCDRLFVLEHGRLVEEGEAAAVLKTASRE